MKFIRSNLPAATSERVELEITPAFESRLFSAVETKKDSVVKVKMPPKEKP